MQHILITGGAGYIGSHTVKQLQQKNYKIIVADSLVYGHKEAILSEAIIFEHGDLSNKDFLNTLFKKYTIEAVIHFAAFAYVGESVTAPSKYYHNNFVATMLLLDTMLAHNCTKIIFSSTCATYGNPQYIPIDEQHPQLPINPYGKTKWMMEHLMQDYAVAYKLQFVILRYFNAAGAAADGSIGEDHNPETHLIPLILDAANGDRDAITVFGTDYDTPDGTCIRDYIHVEDLADAHILALEHLLANKENTICNLGTGIGVSVKEMIEAVEAITQKKVPVVYSERRAGDPPQLIANASKAKTVLGWQAKYIDIKKVITHAWAWKTGAKNGKYSA
jgi:UDP-glucose 4-epimerase